jgi:hypothetical protein
MKSTITLLAKFTIALAVGLMLVVTMTQSAWAQERTYTPAEIQAAFKAVLDHNDLSDREALAKHLGIEMRLDKGRAHKDTYEIYYGRTLRNPSFLFAGMSYHASVDKTQNTTSINLSVEFRECPNFKQWGKDWKLDIPIYKLSPHNPSSYLFFGKKDWDIGLMRGDSSRDGCTLYLQQNFNRTLSLVESPRPVRLANENYVRKLIDLLTSGDLRNDKQVATILQIQLKERSVSWEGERSFSMLSAIDGFSLSYFFNDSRFRGLFFKRVDRFVNLTISLDTQLVCIKATDLTEELDRRAIKYGYESDVKWNLVSISVRSDNLITLKLFSEDDCVSFALMRQITDVMNSPSHLNTSAKTN